MSGYHILEVTKRSMPPRPKISSGDAWERDVCPFCKGDLASGGRHGIFLPIRYDSFPVCDDCAMTYSIVTECCGDIGGHYAEGGE